MQTAICHYSFGRRFRAEKWSLTRLVQEVQALDVPGVDFHAKLIGPLEAAGAAIRAALSGSRVRLAGLSMGNNFSSDKPEEVRAQVENVKSWIKVAAEVKAPVARIFGGSLPLQQRADPEIKKRKTQQVIDCLGEVTRAAEKVGLVLALENHGHLPCTGEEQVAMIRAVNSSCLKATIDVGNYMSCGQEGPIGTRLAASYCAYVHFKDFQKIPDPAFPWGWKIEGCGLGEGTVDHRACLEALREAGYNGSVALEYEGKEDEVTGVPKSIAYLKKIMQDKSFMRA